MAEHAGSFSADQYAALASVDQGHFWFASRNRLILWALGRYFPRARSFLEVGCGPGVVLEAVRRACPSMALAGCDVGTSALKHARARVPGGLFFVADARDLPLCRESDVVGAFDVLEHIDDDAGALSGLRRALAPGGGLLLTVPQHMWLWSPADDVAKHMRRYARRDLLARVTRAGFDVLHVTSFVSVLLPLMAVLAAHNRRARSAPDLHLRYPRVVHASFRAALTVERLTIRAGVSWPFGGSLLVVARARPLNP